MSHPEGDKGPHAAEETLATDEGASSPRGRFPSNAPVEGVSVPRPGSQHPPQSIPARRSSRPPPRPEPTSAKVRRPSEPAPPEAGEPVVSGPRARSNPPPEEEVDPALVPIQIMRVIAIGRDDDDDAPELAFGEPEIGEEDIEETEEEGAEALTAALHAAALEAPRPDLPADGADGVTSDREPLREDELEPFVPEQASGDAAVAAPGDAATAEDIDVPIEVETGGEEEVEALDEVEVAVEPAALAPERRPPKPPAKSAPPRIQAKSQLPQPPATRRRPWWEHLFGDDFARAYRPLTESQVRAQADFIEKSFGLSPGAVILDLCCGQGQQAVELASRGYSVVGYDLSVYQLALAAENAQARQLKINFLQGDAREMAFDQMFDGLLCWDTSFGYFEEEKNYNVAERMFKALRPGGVLLLDMLNRDFVAVESPNHVWFEGDGCICMDDVSLDWITSRLRVKRSLILDDGRSREVTYSLRLYSLHELGKLLHDVGFRVTQASGDLKTPGVFLGPCSPRIIIRAQKPGG